MATIDNGEGMAQLLEERTGEQLAECVARHGQADVVGFAAKS